MKKSPIKIEIIITDSKGKRINSKCIDVEDSTKIEEMNLDIGFLGDGKNLHLSTVEFSAKHFNKIIYRDEDKD